MIKLLSSLYSMSQCSSIRVLTMEDYTSAAASRKMVAKSCTTVFVIVAEWDPTGVKKLAENESFQ